MEDSGPHGADLPSAKEGRAGTSGVAGPGTLSSRSLVTAADQASDQAASRSNALAALIPKPVKRTNQPKPVIFSHSDSWPDNFPFFFTCKGSLVCICWNKGAGLWNGKANRTHNGRLRKIDRHAI